jgi:hypothetical protein
VIEGSAGSPFPPELQLCLQQLVKVAELRSCRPVTVHPCVVFSVAAPRFNLSAYYLKYRSFYDGFVFSTLSNFVLADVFFAPYLDFSLLCFRLNLPRISKTSRTPRTPSTQKY